MTTSAFQRGVDRTVAEFQAKRIVEIDLMDADRFFDVLHIHTRPPYSPADKFDARDLMNNMKCLQERELRNGKRV